MKKNVLSAAVACVLSGVMLTACGGGGDEGGNGGNSGGDALEAFVAAAWPQIENALQRTRERR